MRLLHTANIARAVRFRGDVKLRAGGNGAGRSSPLRAKGIPRRRGSCIIPGMTGLSQAGAAEAPRSNLPEYTVSELAAALKRRIEESFAYVRVRGEISGWKRHSS